MYRPRISRADLVRCLAADEQCLEMAASMLGYERARPQDGRSKLQMRVDSPQAEVRETGESKEDGGPYLHDARFWQHFRTEKHLAELIQSEDSGPAPPTPAALTAGLLDSSSSDGRGRVPHPPLIPWNKMWTFARAALGTNVPTSRIDIRTAIRRVSRGEVLDPIPFRTRRTWAPRAHVLIDLDWRLVPFRRDQCEFRERLLSWRGKSGLRFRYMVDRPGGRVCRYGSRVEEPYVFPDAETPVLVLSDLGCVDHSGGLIEDWRRFGQALTHANRRPVALAPCPRPLWKAPLDRVWRMACWDRGQTLPRLPDGRQGGLRRLPPAGEVTSDPGLSALLACLSPMANVEPALLRALRLAMVDLGADVATESLAWHHRDVKGGAASAMGLWPDESLRERHRAEFEKLQPGVRERVREIIAQYHGHPDTPDQVAIWLEELCHLETLVDGQCRLSSPARTLFERVLSYVKAGNIHQRGYVGVLAWFNRLSRRLPPAVMATPVLSECARLVAERLAELEPDRPVEQPTGINIWRPVRETDLPPGEWWHVVQQGEELIISPPSNRQPADGGAPFSWIRAHTPVFEVLCERRELDAREAPTKVAYLVRNPGTGAPPGIPLSGVSSISVVSDRQRIESRPLHPRRGDGWSAMGVDRYGMYAELEIAGVVQRMRWIGPGTFQMGSPPDELERGDSETQHEVTLSRGFWLADTACTQELWTAVMGSNPSRFKADVPEKPKGRRRRRKEEPEKPDDGRSVARNLPVESVSWEDLQGFLEKANAMLPDGGLTLPYEAQWEYACRAGTETPFWFGETITTDQVNFHGKHPYGKGEKGEYRGRTVGVKELPCNGWGLYQMHGNVWEWCQDSYGGKYAPEPATDPEGPKQGAGRVVRGGSWGWYAGDARSAVRNALRPGFRYDLVGFRFARGQ